MLKNDRLCVGMRVNCNFPSQIFPTTAVVIEIDYFVRIRIGHDSTGDVSNFRYTVSPLITPREQCTKEELLTHKCPEVRALAAQLYP